MKNEKGLTLIELLAVIAILGIISTVLIGVFINIQKNYQSQNNQILMGQEANILVAQLKSYHQNNILYPIEYNSTQKKAYIGPGKHLLVNDSLKVEILTLQQDEATPFNGTIITVDPTLPLYVKIKITNENGKTVLIDTIITNYQGG